MLSRSPCKWCGSLWHSKNKCDKREISPFKPVYKAKGTKSPLSTENPSDRSYEAQESKQALIAEADRVFSIYIRTKDVDSNGIVECVVCKQRFHWRDVDAGHFIPRRFMFTRWDENNVHVECRYDNRINDKHLIAYERFMNQKYGDEFVDALKTKSQGVAKYTNEDITMIINKYKELVF